jgi:ADP-ribose pyrophosphatase YjhB (NUDIX family)
MVDVVILTILDARLHVLLVRRPNGPTDPFPGHWALPGGFVDVQQDESLEACALRKLREKTGVRSPYLEQLGSWGSARRDPRGWSATHVYFALLAATDLRLERGGNAADVSWTPVEDDRVKVHLAFDHGQILRAALERVRGKTEYTSLPIHLLPREFTLTELQRVFEIVLGRPLEKKAFRTRVLAADLLETADELKETSRRPAQLYRAKRKGGLVYFPRALEQPR